MVRRRAPSGGRLAAQCREYDLALHTLAAQPTNASKSWLDETSKQCRPELIALDYFRRQGYSGSWCEGGALLLLIKAAALPALVKHNTFGRREDACRRYLEAQCVILAAHQDEILAQVSTATADDIGGAAKEILADAFIAQYFPRVQTGNILLLWRALGPTLLTEITRTFFKAPYDFRSGWPDLTLVRNGEARFVEVKTSDLLHPSQVRIIEAFAKPFGLAFSIAHITAGGV